MSKSKTSPVVKPEKERDILSHIAATCACRAAKLKNKKGVLAMIGFTLLILSLVVFTHTGHFSEALLYIFANNGKLSGRADGNVYMRNGRVRGFVVPSLVQNTYTQTQRVQLGLISAGWRALSNSDQLSWNNLAGLFRSDRFGNPVEIKGKAAYVLLNMNLFNIGAAPITTAPALVDVPCITDATLTATVIGQINSLAFTPTPTSAVMDHLIYATAPQGAGIFKPSQSKYRLVTVLPNTTASPFVFSAAYTAKFGAFVAGQKIFVKIIGINNTTGQASPALQVSDIAA